jgi:hypothetical protein
MERYDPDVWWAEMERDVIDCLEAARAATPGEIGRRLGMSEDAAVSLIGQLALEGKVKIALVEVRR